MNSALAQVVAVFSMIVGVAIIAVLVSKNANTSQVIQTTFSGFGSALATAVSPVTGSSGGLAAF